MSDNYMLALEEERETREAELTRLRAEVERLARQADEFAGQARIATRGLDEARAVADEALRRNREKDSEAWDMWRAEQTLKEQAERDRDAAMEASRKAHADWEATAARAEKAEADCAALRAAWPVETCGCTGDDSGHYGVVQADTSCPSCGGSGAVSPPSDAGSTLLERLRAAEAVVGGMGRAVRPARKYGLAALVRISISAEVDGRRWVCSLNGEESIALERLLENTP